MKMMIKGMMIIEPSPNKTLVTNDEKEARTLAEQILSGREIHYTKEQRI